MKLITALATTTLATLVAGSGSSCSGLKRKKCGKTDGCVYVKWKTFPEKVKNAECREDEGCPTWPSKYKCKKEKCHWHGTKAAGSCKKDPPTDDDKKRCATRPKPSRCRKAGCYWAGSKETGKCFDKAPACDFYSFGRFKRDAKKHCKKAGCHWEGTKKRGKCMEEAPTTVPPTTTAPPTTTPKGPDPIGVTYELVGGPLSHEAGMKKCAERGCRLPNVRNHEERSGVLSKRGSWSRIWTNAWKTDPEDKTSFRWDNGDGELLSSTTNFWMTNEPGNQEGKENCVELWDGTGHAHMDGLFNDLNCDYTTVHGVVCECDVYERRIVGVEYEIHPDGLTHTRNSAFSICEAKFARLPNIRNDKERQGVLDANAGKHARVWTNGFKTDEDDLDSFRWDNGKGAKITDFWLPGKPDNVNENGFEENCVDMYTESGKFNDLDCHHTPQSGIVCEHDVWSTKPIVP